VSQLQSGLLPPAATDHRAPAWDYETANGLYAYEHQGQTEGDGLDLADVYGV